jgi:hypothetical protein
MEIIPRPKRSKKILDYKLNLLNTCITIQRKLRYKQRKQLKKSTLYITPISQTYKKKIGIPCSRKDWEEQEKRELLNKQVMWDGPSLNIQQPKKNDLLTIWKYQKCVIIYKITDVYSPKFRLDSWSMNIGQSERNVIYLKKLIIIKWDIWIQLGGHKRCMGTNIIKTFRDNIILYIYEKMFYKYD